MIAALQEMYSFSFMRYALTVGIFGGGMLAFLGIFVHLRRIVFLGAALPQITALGIALAVCMHLPPLVGAILGGLVGVLLLSTSGKSGNLPTEGWIGLAYATGGSLAIVVLAISPHPDAGALRFFTGDILGTNRAEAIFAVVVAVCTAAVFRLCWSKFVVSSFDPVMTKTLGLRASFWNALLFLCLGFGLASVMNSAGSMLAFGMLIGPPAAALMLFRGFPQVIVTTIVLGAVSAFAGLTLSFVFDLPGGPTMATAALFPMLPAWIYRKIKR